MAGSLGSKVAALTRAQLAMALTAADGMERYARLTLKCAKDIADALEVVARVSSEPRGRGGDDAAAKALAGYRDYVRELAALPGIASMIYYEQLDRLRAAARGKNGSATPSPPPASKSVPAASKPRPPDRPERPTAQSKGKSG